MRLVNKVIKVRFKTRQLARSKQLTSAYITLITKSYGSYVCIKAKTKTEYDGQLFCVRTLCWAIVFVLNATKTKLMRNDIRKDPPSQTDTVTHDNKIDRGS